MKLDRWLLQTWEQNSCVFHLDLSVPYHLLCVSPNLIPALSKKDRSVDFLFLSSVTITAQLSAHFTCVGGCWAFSLTGDIDASILHTRRD